MVVDRRIAIIQSNNIQENDNCEMTVQLEGPIVDSFYDVALISWHIELRPPLPCLSEPAAAAGLPTFENKSHATLFDQDGTLVPVYLTYACVLLGLHSIANRTQHKSHAA
jgi:hypothetical protein